MKEPFYSIHNARMRGEKRKTEIMIKLLKEIGSHVPAVSEVMDVFKGDPWMTASWLYSANTRLNNKVPIELLRNLDSSNITKVVKAARLFGEHGAV